jgi:hypothetical protein
MERIEFAWAVGRLAGPKVLLGEPVGHRARIECHFPGDLRGIEPLVLMEIFDLAEARIVDHERHSLLPGNQSASLEPAWTLIIPGASTTRTEALGAEIACRPSSGLQRDARR